MLSARPSRSFTDWDGRPHHPVGLRIGAEQERLAAGVSKAALLVEPDRARVSLPDAQPHQYRAASRGGGEDSRHEPPGEPGPVRRPVHVEPVQLDGRARRHAWRWRGRPQLSKGEKRPGPVRDQRDAIGIGQLGALLRLSVAAGEMGGHVLGRVVGGERLGERPRRERGEGGGIRRDTAADRDGGLRRVAAPPLRPSRLAHGSSAWIAARSASTRRRVSRENQALTAGSMAHASQRGRVRS